MVSHLGIVAFGIPEFLNALRRAGQVLIGLNFLNPFVVFLLVVQNGPPPVSVRAVAPLPLRVPRV